MARISWFHQLAIVLVVTSLAMPARLWLAFGPFASASVMDLALVLAGIFLIFHIVVYAEFDVGHPLIFALLCVPLLLGVLSLAWSQDVTLSIKWLLIMAESLVAYLVAVMIYARCSAKRIVWYMGLLILVCLTGSVLSLLRVPGFEPTVPLEYPMGTPAYVIYLYTYYARLSHPFIGLSNALARALVAYVPIFFVWGVYSRNRRYYLLTFVTMLAIVFTLSRGVLIPFAVISVILLSRRELWRYLLWLVPVTALMVLTIFGVYTLEPEIGSTLSDRTSESNVQARAEKVTIGLEKIMTRPVLGYGAGVPADGDQQLVGGSHNILVDMALYFGIIPGLFVCISLVAVSLVFFAWTAEDRTIRLMRSVIGWTLVCQLLGFLSESAFDTSVLRVLFYFFIGSSVALLRALEMESEGRQRLPYASEASPIL